MVWAALLVFCALPSAFAQDDEDEAPSGGEERLEGLTIDKLEIEAAPREDKQRLLASSGLAEGAPYQAEQIRRAVKVLYQVGRFDNVFVVARRAGNVVEVKLLLNPRPVVREVTIIGSGEVSSSVLEQAASFKVGDELVLGSLQERRHALERVLERAGHRGAAIGLAAQRMDENGGAEVVIRVDEGPLTRLRNVIVRGRPRWPLWRISEAIGLKSGDVLDLNRIETGVKRLVDRYKSRDFFEATVTIAGIRELNDSADKEPLADLVVDIDSGPQTFVRFNGQVVVPQDELLEATSVLRELGATRAALSEARERILSRYERRGYWRARVEPAVRQTPDGGEQEVLFSIDEGAPAWVDEIVFEGNQAFDDDLLRDTIVQVVEQSLSEEFARPAADPTTISAILDPETTPEKNPRPAPHPADPNPRRVYVDRAYRAGSDAIADLYRAAGYQTVEVDAPEPVVGKEGRTMWVRVAIRPGVRWMMSSIAFSGNEVIPSSDLLAITALEPGQPLSFDRVEASRRALLAYYKDRGYLYARIDEELRSVSGRGGVVSTSSAAALDVRSVCGTAEQRGEKECPLELAFKIREGAQVRAREVILRGTEGTRHSLVLGEVTVTEGEILRESDLAETQRNLLRLGIFQRVIVRPMDEEAEAPLKDVLVEVREGKHSSFEIGAGASTEEGVRIFAGYGHTNVAGSALRFQANAKVNVQPFLLLYNQAIRESLERFYADRPIEYLAAIGFSYPRILGLPRGFSSGLDLAVVRDNDPTFSEDTRVVTLTGDYEGFRPTIFGAPRPLTLQLRASFDWADLKCNPDVAVVRGRAFCGAESDDPARRFEGTTIYTGFRPSASWDLRDDALNPRSGLYLEVQPELLLGLNEVSPNHINVRAKINGYLPVLPKSALAISLVMWRIFPLDNEQTTPIPVNRRFFAGGRATIRGYPEQTLFPRDAPPQEGSIGLSPGGLLMVALKSEIRFPLADGLEGTIFYDIGDLFVQPGSFVIDKNSRMGAGFGLRYTTPIGPLLLDIAFPLSEKRQPDELTWVPHFAAVGSF